jgi:ABC-type transporter Mla MlaB component
MRNSKQKGQETHCEVQGNVVHIIGEVNFNTCMPLYHAGVEFLKKSPVNTFDFSQATKANSAAIALIFAWQRKAKQLGHPIHMCNIPQKLLTMAQLSNVDTLLAE